MTINLSPDQAKACFKIVDWIGLDNDQCLTLGGYAGTGKTTVLAYLSESLPDLSIAHVSLTGKAAAVLRKKMKRGLVTTIHSLFYYPIINDNGMLIGWEKRTMYDPNCGRPRKDNEIPPFDLIVNDEASMTSQDLYNDMAVHGTKILAVGDHGQLPPIGTDFNLMKNPRLRLEEPHRFAEDNPILKVATIARKKGQLAVRDYSPKVRVFSVNKVPHEVDELALKGSPDTLVITGRNDARVAFNKETLERRGRATKDLDQPQPGDRLICLRNDPITGLYNGALCTLLEVYEEARNHFYAQIQADDFDYPQDVTIARWAINNPKPKQPTPKPPGLPFDYGYCLTCHKAQGSEAKRVIVIGGGFGDWDMRRRWLYTAVTRAQEELYVIQ